MKNLEAILRANDLSMLQIYYLNDPVNGWGLRITLVEFDESGDREDGELTVDADEDDDSIEKLLALLEQQAEITLRENAAEVFWKARESEKEES